MVQPETFSERLSRLVEEAKMSDADLASVLGLSENQARRIMSGTTSTMKLDAALKLCRKLKVSPWYLQGVPEPSTTQPADDVETALRSEFERLLASLGAELRAQLAEEARKLQETLGALAAQVDTLQAAQPQPDTSSRSRRTG